MSQSFRLPFKRQNLTTFDSGAGTLAFVLRAGVNLILLLTRLKRIKRYGAVHRGSARASYELSADRSLQRVPLRRD